MLAVIGLGSVALAAILPERAVVTGGATEATVPTERPAEVPADAGTVGGAGRAAHRLADPLPSSVRHIVVGGGPTPDSNEVEIERTVQAAVDALGGDTVVLFAGGPDTRSVQVEDGPIDSDPLLTELGELFAPRNGRAGRYRATTLSVVHGAAELDVLETQLARAMGDGALPLDLFLIGHGAGGDTPIDSVFLTWGGATIDAIGLAALLDSVESDRQVRVVATSCFSGGLSEIALEGADPAAGATTRDRCGVFATMWDLEAAGCDPDPRSQSDGYGIHFFAALTGHAVDGSDASDAIDLDDDGVVSLLEAHTRARIASRSIDVPTTTSNRLLRSVAPVDGPQAPVELPEEEAVMAALGEALDESSRGGVETRATDLETSLAEAAEEAEHLAELADEAFMVLTGELLSRWPVLDDPYHPAFADTLANDRAEIEDFLSASPARADLELATATLEAHETQMQSLELELALLRRWLDADETLALASRLRARGGAAWGRYERMRACENGPP